MLKKIFDDIGMTETLGFIAICVLGVLYFYFNPSIVKESEIQIVNIKLSVKPEFSKATTEIAAYLKLIDNDYEQNFELKDCSLSLINKKELLNLDVGDNLRITAKASDLNSGKTYVNNYISVYGIELPKGRKILDIKDYNSCKKNSWKKFKTIGVVFLVILIIGLIKKRIKNVG
ncbi:hypothetical protein [Psychroserpens sp. NJDZ02]|uniref:hypothetical protein n=1 Tax=Psychroserpens sp. NJDZ02 TaxID=2570561 RepID=UPI0010A83E94|nr:hypothetical protein [Psychroserpens sp. NJDZ02]QCE40671.1 hypothetical protein E9099_04300 [Psychroserpens sp. NJDZ02]